LQRGFQLTGSPVAPLALFLAKSGGCLWVFRRYFGNQRQRVAILDVRECWASHTLVGSW
jgi:hypothetical protein